jgi:translation initiation factor 3 subunit A
VGQDAAAAMFLHETILSRKIRSSPLNVVEPIMKKFVHLCVDQRKSKMLKEGLHQYKNISQNVTVSSIEEVLSQCISLSQQKLEEAQSKADQVVIESIEDLDADTVLITGETKDRTDRELVTPWMKFLWDAYRTALDILRNNVRLETLYQSIANQAFQFCLKYARKNEFRRLCELIRQHLAVAAKHGSQTYAINLTDPDTLQRHLDTRFVQLNIASELELWQEAFRSIEDIRQLLTLGQRSPKPFILANYYEKMASIFLVGQNNLFHAAAFGGYFSVVKEHKTIKSDELER